MTRLQKFKIRARVWALKKLAGKSTLMINAMVVGRVDTRHISESLFAVNCNFVSHEFAEGLSDMALRDACAAQRVSTY